MEGNRGGNSKTKLMVEREVVKSDAALSLRGNGVSERVDANGSGDLPQPGLTPMRCVEVESKSRPRGEGSYRATGLAGCGDWGVYWGEPVVAVGFVAAGDGEEFFLEACA